jgi:raffinose/stachyose/melibiose transport system permease protein
MHKNPAKKLFFIYLAPPIIIYCLVVLLPVFMALFYSLFSWSGGPNTTLLKDTVFWKSFKNNIILTILCIIGQIGLALILALILYSRFIKAKKFHLFVSYIPVILSAVVVGYIWSMLYDYNYGLFNTILRAVGLDDAAKPWLSDVDAALLLVSFPLIWKNIGYYLIILLAGLASIDRSVLEMAEIDGANAAQRLRSIILPMLRSTLIVSLTLCISGNMKIFDHIYVMTGGGPGSATMVMALYAYTNSFVRYKMGYGSTLSIGILVLSVSITLIVRKFANKNQEA